MRAAPILSCSAFLLALAVAPPRAAGQEDAFSLQGLVVTASPTPRSADAVASHVTVLQGDELRATGVTSLGEALREVAGLDVARAGSFGALTSLFLRGGESDHTLVLVDGVQVNQAGGSFDFATLTTDNVERIEIVRGPSSALYGSDAMAGVVHVITRIGRGAPRVTAAVEAASYAEPRDEAVDGLRWSAEVTGGSDRFGYSATLARDATDGILDFNNRHRSTVLSGSARLMPDDVTRVGLSLRLTDRTFQFPTDGSGRLVDRNAFSFGDETLSSLTVDRRLSDHVSVRALVAVHETDTGTDDAPDDPSDADGFQSLDHFRRTVGELRANLMLGEAVFTLGGELEEERQRSFSEATSAFGPFYGRSESERANVAGFAHLTGRRGPVAFNAGTRVEDNERFGTGATWQLGVSAHLPGEPTTRLRASIGTAIKEPTFFENFATGFVVGNPNLDPERSRSWEVGVEHTPTEDLRLQATYFHQSLQDLIQYTSTPPAPGGPNYHNVGAARARGVEVDASVRVGAVETGASYTWLDTRVDDAGFDSGPDATFVEGGALLRRPAHGAALRAAAPVTPRGRLFARLSWVGSRGDLSFDPTTFTARRVELPGHVLLTLGGEWQVASGPASLPDLTITLRAENVLDEAYEEVTGFRAPGRQIYIGARVAVGG